MTPVLGIDLGTSGVKSVLVDERDHVVAEASAPIALSRPQPQWCEQNPQDWWAAVAATLDLLRADAPRHMAAVGAIGLSGQMLGVTCLDGSGQALRPAILWNDGRAQSECAEIEAAVPDFAGLVGCRAMAGFPAPKLLWLRRHEPDLLDQTRTILMPKDYIRLCLSGDIASDSTDSSATLLMETRVAAWSPALLSACGLSPDQMPTVVGSHEIGGGLRPTLAARWGMAANTPIVGGAGDNMCGGVGAGIVEPGLASISLGTSGVYFLANNEYRPARGQGMHTHRHAVTGLFAQNACMLSAGAALSWVAQIVGANDIATLMREVEAAGLSIDETPIFTPYLAGERTPHDDMGLTGTFSGLSASTTPLHMVQAVLEGVAMALADCHRALRSTGSRIMQVALVGGGAKSDLWSKLVASAIDMPLGRSRTAAVGPALGAARLARLGIGGPLVAGSDEASRGAILPDLALADALAVKRARFERHLVLR
jgi:xylulokinase